MAAVGDRWRGVLGSYLSTCAKLGAPGMLRSTVCIHSHPIAILILIAHCIQLQSHCNASSTSRT